jgi:hypothetical protein
MCGCETWTLTLGEEHTLKVFENRRLRRIFGLKRVEMLGDWRKLDNKAVHNLDSLLHIIRVIKSRSMRWTGHVACMWEKINAYRILMGNPERKRLLERPKRKWEDHIKLDLREIGKGGMDWVNLIQDWDLWKTLVNMAVNLWVP